MVRKLVVLISLCVSFTLCQASVILSPSLGTLDLLVLSDPGFITIGVFDIRNSALVSVDNPVSVGGVIITDGTILGIPSPTSPNSLLYMLNIAMTEGALVTFTNPRFGGSGVLLDAVLSPLDSITDPALAVALSGGPYVFDFVLTGGMIDLGDGVLSSLSFVSATGAEVPEQVPEPATFALLGVGLACGLVLRRRDRAAA